MRTNYLTLVINTGFLALLSYALNDDNHTNYCVAMTAIIEFFRSLILIF